MIKDTDEEQMQRYIGQWSCVQELFPPIELGYITFLARGCVYQPRGFTHPTLEGC